MDPDVALANLRADVNSLLNLVDHDSDVVADLAAGVAEQFDALDEWITKGGYPPLDWGYRVPRTVGGDDDPMDLADTEVGRRILGVARDKAASLSLAEVRNGTGFERGTRFIPVPPDSGGSGPGD